MRIFVTGSNGFIGKAVVDLLLEAGHSVAVLRRKSSKVQDRQNISFINVMGDNSEFSKESLMALVEFQPEATLHMGWIGVGNVERNNPIQLNNLAMSHNVFTASQLAGVKHFVGVGSQAEYGACSGAIGEDQPLNPSTLYGSIKASTYLTVRALAKMHEINFSWIRIFSTYGPGDAPHWMIQEVAHSLIRGESPKLTAGEQKWDYLYVDDAARAIAKIAASQDALGVLNLGSGESSTIREIVTLLRNCVDSSLDLDFGAVPYRPDQVMHLEANISKLRSKIDWSPIVGLEEGLKNVVEEIRSRSI